MCKVMLCYCILTWWYHKVSTSILNEFTEIQLVRIIPHSFMYSWSTVGFCMYWLFTINNISRIYWTYRALMKTSIPLLMLLSLSKELWNKKKTTKKKHEITQFQKTTQNVGALFTRDVVIFTFLHTCFIVFVFTNSYSTALKEEKQNDQTTQQFSHFLTS